MRSSTRVKAAALIAASGLALTMLAGVGPASALGTKSPVCGSAQYNASSTATTASSSKRGTNDCELYAVRGHYYYNGNAYWSGWATNASTASVTGSYDGFDKGEHYTKYSSTVTT